MKLLKPLVFFIALAVMAAGCKKDAPGTVTFNSHSNASFQIPPNTILDIPAILTPGISTDWTADFQNNDTNKDKIRNMKLSALKLIINNPPGKTFNFLKDMDIYITADGLQETLIAYKHGIPETVGQSLDLDVVDTDIAPYAKKDNFQLRVSLKPDDYNSDYVDVTAQMTFKITADVIN